MASALVITALLAVLWGLLQTSQHVDGLRSGALTLALAAVVALGGAAQARWTVVVPPRTRHLLVCACALLLAVGALGLVRAWEESAHFRDFRSTVLDIGANTSCAAAALLRGANPYAVRCQRTTIVHEPARGVIRRADGAVTLWGVPYRYGFPYFPLMAAAFVPGEHLLGGVAGLRATILAVLAATLLASAVFARVVVAPGARALAWGATWAALLANPAIGFQLFEECSTDVAIAPVLLLAFAAFARGRFALSGALAAVTLGLKLFPGAPIVAALALAASARPGALRRFAGAAAVTGALTFAPALLAGPTDFASATLLFYAVAHDVERSALAGFIPAAARPVWFAAGAALVAWSLRGARRGDTAAALRAFVLADLVFIAFNKMSHLNYFEPLGPALMLVAWLPPAGAGDTSAVSVS